MIDEIMDIFNIDKQLEEITKIQIEHRLKLIDFWGIEKGSRILEIGCGQGDTTVPLAFRVGESGFVLGVDIAKGSYGAPETLAQARERIKRSSVGNQVEMKFDFDILKNNNVFKQNEFDYIILSHCLWYFESYEMLNNIIDTVKPFGKKICIAEWNPKVRLSEQLPHYTSVNIQAICESFKHSSQSNIRTMFYPSKIKETILSSGFNILKEGSIYSPKMQDAIWEVNMTVQLYPKEINSLSNIPENLRKLLLSQIEDIKVNNNINCIKPMDVFCLMAIK